MSVVHMLSFPGAFAPAGLLGGGAQTTGYLHVFWHLGFPLACIAYAFLKDGDHLVRHRRRDAAAAVAVTLGVAAALATVAVTGGDWLPQMLHDGRYSSAFNVGRYGQWAVTAAALVILFTRRSTSTLDLWLSVVLAAWFFEIGLVAIVNAGRWDVGFYAGRLYAVAASCVVLITLLTEQSRMYHDLAEAQAAARTAAGLQRTREVLGIALQAGRMGVFSWDLRADRAWWSPELEQMIGLAPGTLEPRPAALLHYVEPADRDGLQAQIRNCIQSGTGCELEFRLHGANGSMQWASARGTVGVDERGQPASVFGVIVDITAQNEAERRLKQADQRKDEFLATLAHELRNPLSPIRNAVELLARFTELPPNVERALAVIDRQSRHLSRLVDDLLEVSRITQGKVSLRKSQVALVDCLSDALHAVEAALKAAGHELSVHLDEDPLYASADGTRIVQCFLNLLNNAIKFTPRGGRIAVTARRAGERAVITIADNGIGIPPDNIGDIFGLFAQVTPALERSQGGLGIGLALVKGFIELHGGTVTAASAGAGRGSTFTVSLPLQGAEAHAPADTPQVTRAAMQHPRRVLVVDDNLDAAASMVALLQAAGHHVREAHDGREGLRLAVECEPEIILLDIGMPGMTGLDVARELRRRARQPAPRIIAVTGWGQEKDRALTREAGFDFHLTKPVNHRELDVLLTMGLHEHLS
jgi:PAS domain S-box-containing protein